MRAGEFVKCRVDGRLSTTTAIGSLPQRSARRGKFRRPTREPPRKMLWPLFHEELHSQTNQPHSGLNGLGLLRNNLTEWLTRRRKPHPNTKSPNIYLTGYRKNYRHTLRLPKKAPARAVFQW